MAHYFEEKLKHLATICNGRWDEYIKPPAMTDYLYPYRALFSPLTINSVTVKNRVIMAPMGGLDLASHSGRPAPEVLNFYEARAKGGAGMIVVSGRSAGNSNYHTPWQWISDVCNIYGTKVFLQLTPGVDDLTGDKKSIIAALNRDRKIIKKAAALAVEAKAGGIAGLFVDITDGDNDKFGLRLISELRGVTGSDFPIIVRLSISGAMQANYGEVLNTDKVLKPFLKEKTVSENLDYIKLLVAAGADAFAPGLGCDYTLWLRYPPHTMPPGCGLDASKIVKEHLKTFKITSNTGKEIPVLGFGKLGYPDFSEQAMRDKKCDAVMLGRPLLADPDWAAKAASGNTKGIRPCMGCVKGCMHNFLRGMAPYCPLAPSVQPVIEALEPEQLAPVPRKCVVAGAGVGGLAAVEVLLKRGHSVDVFDPRDIGGGLNLGGIPKTKYELRNYTDFLTAGFSEMAEERKLKFHKAYAGLDMLKARGADALFTANGTKDELRFTSSNITSNSKHILTVKDVFTNPRKLDGAGNVAVIGGGITGIECAWFLTLDLRKKVTVIEKGAKIMQRANPAAREHMITTLKKLKTQFEVNTELVEIDDKTLLLRKKSTEKNGPAFHDFTLSADIIVIATGASPDNALAQAAKQKNAVKQVESVDCSKIMDAHRTIAKAVEAAREI